MRALCNEPMAVRFSGVSSSTWRSGISGSTGAAMVVGLVFGVACAFVGLASGGTLREALLMLGLAMPLLLVQDCWRAGFFAAGRGDLAFANDAVWALVQFPLMVVVLTSTASRSVAVFVLVWSAGGTAAALFGALQARSVPRPRPGDRMVWAAQGPGAAILRRVRRGKRDTDRNDLPHRRVRGNDRGRDTAGRAGRAEPSTHHRDRPHLRGGPPRSSFAAHLSAEALAVRTETGRSDGRQLRGVGCAGRSRTDRHGTPLARSVLAVCARRACAVDRSHGGRRSVRGRHRRTEGDRSSIPKPSSARLGRCDHAVVRGTGCLFRQRTRRCDRPRAGADTRRNARLVGAASSHS